MFPRSTPIPLVEITQRYGTLKVGKDAEHRCIERKDDRVLVRGRLRPAPDARVPKLGVAVRGGYAEVPSDSSDWPEPSLSLAHANAVVKLAVLPVLNVLSD